MNRKPDKPVSHASESETKHSTAVLHPSWLAFMRHCQEIGFGEIGQLKIQDGLPVMAEESVKKIKFI